MNLIISQSIKLFLLLTVLLFTINAVDAAIVPSDQQDYEVMAEGRSYVAYFSQFDTNGFTYEISGHSFSFFSRELSYTDDGSKVRWVKFSKFNKKTDGFENFSIFKDDLELLGLKIPDTLATLGGGA